MSETIKRDAAVLLGSLLTFTQTFYKLRTGREFELSHPIGCESHFVTICRALTKILRGEIKRLIINVPPRYAKTELMINFIAWSLAHYPDSNTIYTSYSKTLAEKQTATVREIVTSWDYQKLFNVPLKTDTNAKGNFETIAGGSVYAVGSQGTITGRGAGIARAKRFGGCIVIDDPLKPEEALSDTVRQKVNEWFFNTLMSRRNNDDDTPIIIIMQRLHDDDLAARLIAGADGHKWDQVILKALRDDGQPLYPEKHTKEFLLNMQDTAPYVFSSQMQQSPQPAGGGIYKKHWFLFLPAIPKIIGTFVTVDTGEGDKKTNDASAFSFWGVYRVDSVTFGLVCLDCRELRCDPADLESQFLSFWSECRGFDVPPHIAAIEKKSTGTTLAAVIKRVQGITVIEIDRTTASGSKIARFVRCQEYVASKLVSFVDGAPHAEMCINHMIKITLNNTHANDDICDTFADAVDLALIKKCLPYQYLEPASETNNDTWGSVI